MNPIQSLLQLSEEMWYKSESKDDALKILDDAHDYIGLDPIILVFPYLFLWKPQVYEAYMGLMSTYLRVCIRHGSESN